MNEQELYGQLGALTKRKEAWRDAIPFVGALLETPSPKITAKALWLLGEMGLKHPGEVAPFAAKIASFLDSPDGQLRERALNALGRIGRARFETVKPHWDKMTGLAADGNPRVRLAFIWASENVATNTPDPYRDCLPLFAALLHDPDDRVRMEAPEMFRVLGKRRPCFVEPYLETLQALALRDPHPVVRIHSAGAVRAVKGRESCVGQEQPSRPDPGVPPLAGSPPSLEYDLLTPGRAPEYLRNGAVVQSQTVLLRLRRQQIAPPIAHPQNEQPADGGMHCTTSLSGDTPLVPFLLLPLCPAL